jgi:hypothetical protein
VDDRFPVVYVYIYDRGKISLSKYDLTVDVCRMLSLDDESHLPKVAGICSIWHYLLDRAEPLYQYDDVRARPCLERWHSECKPCSKLRRHVDHVERWLPCVHIKLSSVTEPLGIVTNRLVSVERARKYNYVVRDA